MTTLFHKLISRNNHRHNHRHNHNHKHNHKQGSGDFKVSRMTCNYHDYKAELTQSMTMLKEIVKYTVMFRVTNLRRSDAKWGKFCCKLTSCEK